MSWIEVQFLRKAVDVLCQCRQTLMYTYVFAYYLRKNNQSIIFEVPLLLSSTWPFLWQTVPTWCIGTYFVLTLYFWNFFCGCHKSWMLAPFCWRRTVVILHCQHHWEMFAFRSFYLLFFTFSAAAQCYFEVILLSCIHNLKNLIWWTATVCSLQLQVFTVPSNIALFDVGNTVDALQDNQRDLEHATEQLSEYLERDITSDMLADIKQKVQDKYRSACLLVLFVFCDSLLALSPADWALPVFHWPTWSADKLPHIFFGFISATCIMSNFVCSLWATIYQ